MKYEANGKIEKDISEIYEIQELIGMKKENVFKCSTEEELEDIMSDMQLVDLQKLAVSSGISGGGNRAVLKEKIRKEFQKFIKNGNGTSLSKSSEMKLKGKDKEKRKKQIKELWEGF